MCSRSGATATSIAGAISSRAPPMTKCERRAKAFASGTDISQFRAFKTSRDALDYAARIDRVLGALEQVRVPTIAAIAGACTGGGAGIAACCDIRIGTAATRIGFPIARTLRNCLSMSKISGSLH
jgi:enoyl-CoA hydratase